MREWRGDADWEGESAKRFESFWETLSFRACIVMIRDRRFLSETMMVCPDAERIVGGGGQGRKKRG